MFCIFHTVMHVCTMVVIPTMVCKLQLFVIEVIAELGIRVEVAAHVRSTELPAIC